MGIKISNNQSRLVYFSVFFLSFCFGVKAQETTLTGAIVIGKSEFMSYKITYRLANNNTLSGTSVCDVNGNEETKAQITGLYNPKDKTLSFEEKSILSTRSMTPKDEFCLMKVSGKFEKKAGKTVFTGEFKSTSLNPEIICDPGSLILLTEKNLNELAKSAAKAIEKLPASDTLKKQADDNSAPIEWVRNVIDLTPGSLTELDLKSDNLQFDIIDDKIQDGDKITLLKNGIVVVSGFEVTNRVKTFKFTIPKEEKQVTFTIIADDEGSVPLTTIKGSLRNGNEVNLIMASMDKGQSVTIVLKRR